MRVVAEAHILSNCLSGKGLHIKKYRTVLHMGKRLLTDRQVEFIHDGPEAVGQSNAWNYRNKIENNLEDGVPQILRLLPELLPFLDTQRIRSNVDGAEIGAALGRLLTRDQRRRLAATLVWGEQRPGESDQDFLDRIPGLIDEFGTGLEPMARRVRDARAGVEFLGQISDALLTKFDHHIAQRRKGADVAMAVPVEQVTDWAEREAHPDEPPAISELLYELHSSWDDTVHEKVFACRDILLSLGNHRRVPSVRPGNVDSFDDKWALHFPPMESDIDQYLAVLDACEQEIAHLVDSYFEAERIAEKDRLVDAAFDVLEGLSKPGRDLLEWDDLQDSRSDWKGHHTRTANYWAGDRAYPVISTARESGDRREWALTAFGEFVRCLHGLGVDRSRIEGEGFPPAVPDELLDAAIAEIEE